MNVRVLTLSFLAGSLVAATLLVASPAHACSGYDILIDGFEGGNVAPVIDPIADRAGLLGDVFRIDVVAHDPDPGDLLAYALVTAPLGMTIDSSSGQIDWTPLPGQAGDHPVTVRACDLDSHAGQASFQITVIAPTAAPRIVPIVDQVTLVDSAFQLQVSVNNPGDGAPISYSLDQAPLGMQVDGSSGLITWNPGINDLGAQSIVVHAENVNGQGDTAPFTLTVIESNATPVLDLIADQGGKPGELFTLTAQASDADGDPLRFFLPAHPPGMSIDPASGMIRWTPASQHLGPHAVTVRVSDPLGFSDTKSFTLMIDRNRAPVALDDGRYTIERGDTLHVPAPGLLANDSDPNNDPLTPVLDTGPSKGVLDLLDDGSFNYTPDNPAGTIGMQLKWSYRGKSGIPNNIPVIIDLDGDGIAEIIMMDGGDSKSQIYALHGDTGAEYFKIPYFNEPMVGGTAFAAADINLDGHPEIIVIGTEPGHSRTQTGKKLMAFDHTGQLKWVSEPLPERYATSTGLAYEGNMTNASITIADIDQDGTPEILVGISTVALGRIGYQVWDNQGNKLDYVHTAGTATALTPARVEVVDLDLDGVPEIVVGAAAWTNDGQLLWSRPDLGRSFSTTNLYPLVANLDDDPYPELVLAGATTGTVVALNHDGSTLWTATYPGNSYGQFGAISIADVDNDGKADILLPPASGNSTFRVLNGADGTLKWSQTAPGSGGGTSNSGWGATVMDMDNDGYNEVVYLDNVRTFHVWDGRDGSVKLEFPSGESGSSSQTSMPIFADVDGDGHAELITIGAYALTPDLIRVYESPQDDWPPMRAIWNQNSYHATNINDDGTVPQFEAPHWLLPGLNQNLVNQRLPEERFSSTDSFTYRASDGELQSNLATVDITILPPNAPPQILSTARLLASPGFEYTYAVLAVDADVGETLSYALQQAPAGMSIDANHVIHWTPTSGDIGDHAVIIAVTDSIGVAAYQSYTLSVVAAVSVPHVAGQVQATAVATLAAASLSADPIEPVYSASVPVGSVVSQMPAGGSQVGAGSSVRLDISKGPQPLVVPNVIGTSREDAEAALAAAGLALGTLDYANDALAPRGTVLTQDPAPQALQPPAEPVNLVVSGGPRALIAVSPAVILAASTAEVAVSIHNPDGSLIDPPPPVMLSLEVQTDDFAGTQPTLNGTTIQTSADGQGVFQVLAAFDTGTPETIGTDVVAMQPISSGASGDLFGTFGAQLTQFSNLLAELKLAVDANDGPAITALDAQLGDLRDAIDTIRLRSMTPLAPEGGVPPSPEIAAANGFPPGPDDLAFSGAARDLIPLLKEIENAIGDEGTPPAVLHALNQALTANVSAIRQLDVQTWGVLDGSTAIINVVGTRVPLLVVANIDRVRQAIADAGYGAGGFAAKRATVPMADFSLSSVLSATSIRTGLTKDLYGGYLYHLIRTGATLAAGDLLQNFVNNTALTGLITGSSIAINIFELPNSVIEGYGFNTQLAEANHVFIVGPQLIDAVVGMLTDLPSADDFKDLNDISDNISSLVDSGDAVNDAFNQANSSPDAVERGCFFESHPTCRQLVYSNGLGSVYQADGALNLPAPVIIIVTNLGAPGGMGAYVAFFVPTRE